ncbi:MAG TPA: RNA methyltransferase [Acidobacteriaceae bacterium]
MLTSDERDRLCVVLVRTRNPLNIGAAARALANFGFGRLRLVRPWEPSFREARSAVGAAPVLATAEELATIAEAVADCTLVVGTTAGEQRTPPDPLERLERVAGPIQEQLRAGGRVAILFGSEKAGLSNEELSYCQTAARIPTEPNQPSMNLGQAVAVTLYELVRAPSDATAEEPVVAPAATAADRERMIDLLTEALAASGPAGDAARVRQLVQHMALTAEDAHGWMGIFRQLLWKLKNTE